MNATRGRSRLLAGALSLALLLGGIAASHAATIVIVNNDGAGEGFNDPTPVAPVGGNPGVTKGAQRLFVFQTAAGIWGGILPSAVTIQVRSQFDPLTCSATSAVLGSAGPTTIHRDFLGAPFAGTWYHQSLANRLFGSDLSAANPDINATFNSNIDAGCFGPGLVWYYGTDGLEGVNIELLPVVLHEMGHGLGFSTTTSGTTGNFNGGFPGVFDRFLYDNVTGLHWYQMTAAQRVASAISIDKLAWDGPGGMYSAAHFLGRKPQMIVNWPGGIAGTYGCNPAGFSPPLPGGYVTGNVVLVNDGVGTVTDGCETPFVNAAAIAGNIALIDRGTCTFVAKAQACEAAGATAVLIANNVAGPLSPGGSGVVGIPVVGITQADGNTIKASLGAGVNVTLNLHPTQMAGADPGNRPLMYAPNPFQSGSSVSHFDVTLSPNALMEPAINTSLHDDVDLTRGAFVDIGWMGFTTPTTLAFFNAEDRRGGILLSWEFSDLSNVGAITVQRAPSDEGPWDPIQVELSSEGARTLALDTSVEANQTYYYRLNVMDRSGNLSNYGLVAGRHAGSLAGAALLMAPHPNPVLDGATVEFRLGQPEFVRLSIVDAGGRHVRTLRQGMMPPGDHAEIWDGRTDASQRVAPGIYFVTLGTSAGKTTRRLAVIQ